MDKYEFNIKVEQIKKLVNKGDFETAMKIADTIDWRRVRNANLLSMIASVYEKNEEYQEAKDILLIAFERAPIGKRLLYKLTQLALKQGNIQEAEAYYREFCELAGDDPRQDILRYLILKAKGAPIEQLIHSLESYTSTELDEKWLYELADLYHQAGMEELCVKTCDKIMLMFGLGQYVDKAMELKLQYAPLTKYQMDLVENRDKYEEKLRRVELNSAAGVIAQDEIPAMETNTVIPIRQEAAKTRLSPAAANDQPAPAQADFGKEALRGEPVPTPIPVPAPDPSMLRPGAAARKAQAASAEAPASAVQAVPEIGPEQSVSIVAEPPVEESALPGTDVTAEERLVASVREAEVEASLAKEMSRISMDSYTDEPVKTQTRVLNDVKELKNAETLSDKTRILDDIRHIQAVKMAEEKSPVQATGKVAPACFLHMMAEARTPEKGLEIAVESLKAAHRLTGEKHPVAKITGSKLNQRGLLANAAKLAGKDLIVEEAGDLNDALLEEFNQLLADESTDMVVVLVDNARQLDGIRKANPSLAGKFRLVSSREEAESFLTAAAAQKKQMQAASVSSQPTEQPPARAAAPRQASRPAMQQAPRAAAPQPEAQQAPSAAAPQSAVQQAPRTAAPQPAMQQAPRTAAPQPAQQQDSREAAAQQQAPKAAVPKAAKAASASGQNRSEAVQALKNTSAAQASAFEEMDENHIMDIDEFAQYCCHYASQIDCSITGKSMLALYERIEIMEEDGAALTKTAAEDLIEGAADKAEKPSLIRRITGLFSSKYDKDGLLILKEEHFI